MVKVKIACKPRSGWARYNLFAALTATLVRGVFEGAKTRLLDSDHGGYGKFRHFELHP